MPIDSSRLQPKRQPLGESNPAINGFAIVPANAELTQYPSCLFVGGAGNLVVVFLEETNDANTVTLAVQPGYHPLQVRRVLPASTATGIVGLVSR